MSGDTNNYNIYFILNFIHFFAKPFGLVRYKRHKDKFGKCVYQAARRNIWHTMHVFGKSDEQFKSYNSKEYIFLAIILIMVGGTCIAHSLLSKDISYIEFDKATLLFMYTEPSITGSIMLVHFVYHHEKLVRAVQLVDNVGNSLYKLNLKPSIKPNVYILIFFYCTMSILGTVYNTLLYLQGRSAVFVLYSYMTCGMALFLQHAIILYFCCVCAQIVYNLLILNDYLETCEQQHEFSNMTEKNLRIASDIHFMSCEALKSIQTACNLTILLYTMRAQIITFVWILSLNGMLPKLLLDFVVQVMCYAITVVAITVLSELLKSQVITSFKFI